MKTTIKSLLLLAFATTLSLTCLGNSNNFSICDCQISIEINDSLEERSTVLSSAEQMPEFVGGTKALVRYLRRNVNYPQEIREKEIEDKVYVEFVVNPDGSIRDIKALTGKNETLKEEAVKVVSKMPKWIPGVNQGETVPVRLILPISFVLK
jgi:protein TonB